MPAPDVNSGIDRQSIILQHFIAMNITKNWKTITTIIIFLLSAVVIFYVWKVWPRILNCCFGYCQADSAGTFGDSYGALNTLFSGLAFLGIIASTIIQGLEFRSQLAELNANNKELHKQTDIYKRQLNSLLDQVQITRRQHIEEQVRAQLLSQPFFIITPKLKIDDVTENETATVELKIENKGSAVYGMCITLPNDKLHRFAHLDANECVSINHRIEITPQSRRTNLTFYIDYITKQGFHDTEKFNFNPVECSNNPLPGQIREILLPPLSSDVVRYAREIRKSIEGSLQTSGPKSDITES